MRRRSFAALLALPPLALPVAAHHGWGSYDATKPMTITAAVAEVMIGNPHMNARGATPRP